MVPNRTEDERRAAQARKFDGGPYTPAAGVVRLP